MDKDGGLEHDFYDFPYIGNMGTNNPNDPIKSDSSKSMWYGNVVTNSSDNNQASNISAVYLLDLLINYNYIPWIHILVYGSHFLYSYIPLYPINHS